MGTWYRSENKQGVESKHITREGSPIATSERYPDCEKGIQGRKKGSKCRRLGLKQREKGVLKVEQGGGLPVLELNQTEKDVLMEEQSHVRFWSLGRRKTVIQY